MKNKWLIACVYSIMPDRLSEGMRELESIRDKPEVTLCTTMALMYAHKKSKNVGKL